MLSRRHLRIKVLLALYAFFQSMNDNIAAGEKELFKSINKLYEIFIYQLSLIIEIAEFAQIRMDENRQKFFPTEEDLNPSTRFVDNRLLKQLSENRDYLKYRNAYKINWSEQTEMIRKLYTEIRNGHDFMDYLAADKNNYNDDRELLIRIVKKHLSHSEILQYFYEDKNIHWSDDFYTANLMAIKTFKMMKDNWDSDHKLPPLYKTGENEDPDEDKEFVKHLFRKTIIRSDEYEKLIEEKVKNWEMDRIAVMDVILLKMALAELIEFKSVPIKVTLNEYIELAKMYSTPKSKVFVNGILDKLISDLKDRKLIKKEGRGLIEN